jgi:hypothetical protein
MAAATFDSTTLIVSLPAPALGLLSMDVKTDIYSDWKVFQKSSENAIGPPAFDVTGGDPIPGARSISGSYFLRNDLGWRIQSTDEDQEVTIIGNLYPRDEARPMFLSRATRTVTYNVDRTASPRDLSSVNIQLIANDLGLNSASPKTVTENTVDVDYTEVVDGVTKTIITTGSDTVITRTT